MAVVDRGANSVPNLSQFTSPEYMAELNEISLRRQRLELLRMEREEEAFTAEQASKAKAREASILMIERQERDLLYKQANCSHMKQWNKGPSVFGQRDGSRNFRFFCCNCFKTWKNFGDAENPEGLPRRIQEMLDMEQIGG